MNYADLQALAVFAAGALALIQQSDAVESLTPEQLTKDYSDWEERIAHVVPFLY